MMQSSQSATWARSSTIAPLIIQAGNKRTAIYAMVAWLEREGYLIEAARGELRDLALSIASHDLDTAQIATWLAQRSKPIRV